MNYGKSLEQVWTWRKSLSKKMGNISEKDQIRSINEDARNICRKYGIKYKVKRRDTTNV